MYNRNESGTAAKKTDGGSGSRIKGVHKTTLGRWLTLFRVQSIPVSAVVASMGYLLAVESTSIRSIVGITAVAALAHAGINTQNDILDLKTDALNKGNDKPLLSGDIRLFHAIIASTLLIGLSVLISYSLFGDSSHLLVASITVATLYNVYSSTKWWSMFLFGAWASLFSMYGYHIGSGQFIGSGLKLSLIFGGLLSSYIFLGDIIDSDADEQSLHKKLGSRVRRFNNEFNVYEPADLLKEKYVVAVCGLMTGGLVAEKYYYVGFGSGIIIIISLMSIATYCAVKISCYVNPLDEEMKRTFIVYVMTTATAIIITYSSFIDTSQLVILILTSILWAVSSMRVLYGRWFYFP